MEKAFFVTLILLGLSISSGNLEKRNQCFRESAEKLSDKGQTTYSNLTGLHIVKYKTLSPEESIAFTPGRRLNSASEGEGTRTEDSFIENGRRCTGYTVNEGKKYCKQPFKEQDGS